MTNFLIVLEAKHWWEQLCGKILDGGTEFVAVLGRSSWNGHLEVESHSFTLRNSAADVLGGPQLVPCWA